MSGKLRVFILIVFIACGPSALAAGNHSNSSNVEYLKALLFSDVATPGTRLTQVGKTHDGSKCTLTMTLLADGVSLSLTTPTQSAQFLASDSSETSKNCEIVDSDENLVEIEQDLVHGDEQIHEHAFVMTEEGPGAPENVVSAEISNRSNGHAAQTDISCGFN